MPDCPNQFQIGAFAEFDPYPAGRDLAILGPTTSVKLRERRQWIERSTVSGVVAGASLAAFDCRVSHRHLPTPSADGREWRPPPIPLPVAASARSTVSHRHSARILPVAASGRAPSRQEIDASTRFSHADRDRSQAQKVE
jgi:hypothetical protein